MELVVFALVMAAIGMAAFLAWRAKQRRRESLRLWALQHGLEFSAIDPFGIPLAYPFFHLFSLGDGRGCENVMSGSWQGLPVKGADYCYYTESTDSKGTRVRSYHRFSIVVADLDCALPHVTVERESVLSTMAGHLGFHDIEFESETFNRRFQVKAEDREYAYQLLDARMIRWLEAMGGDLGFEVRGPNLLVWSGRRRAGRLTPLFGSARMFCDHIPRLVRNEYGSGPAGPDLPGPGHEERSTT